MKPTNLFLAALVVLTTTSFKDKNSVSPKVMTGTYGVCNCGAETSTKVELTINEDFTFNYFDNSNPTKIIDVKGSWIYKGSTILLKDYNSDLSIHTKWQVDKNAKCLKSRKGLEFTRLCNIKACN